MNTNTSIILKTNFMFKDRIEAGNILAQRLRKFKNENGIILVVPKGAVPIGYVVAKELGWPMDLILSKKIGHPANKEYAIGAVSLTGSFIIPHEEVSQSYIDRETTRIRENLENLRYKLMGDVKPMDLRQKVVIVIDDGIATGNTLLATINILKKQQPAKIIIAVPVSSSAGYKRLSKYVDELIALEIPEHFSGVGAYYEDFTDVSEDMVIGYFDALRKAQPQP